ncbi:alpha/beta hydrolase [Puia sp.]|uniref:alpha/beta hydrolase n=1 Tax=Puia sp. TaxID=2045100 RepID=UPI002F428506
MSIEKSTNIRRETMALASVSLGRTVTVDFYLPVSLQDMRSASLLLINDGQDLARLGLSGILDDLYNRDQLAPLLCVGIHAGEERNMEYGTAGQPDYQGWGAKAGGYTRFIFDELVPAVRRKYRAPDFREKAFAGFSLGALSAMDIVWNHPQEFSKAGLFSGSFWWRTKDKNDPAYNEHTDRIMQAEVRGGGYYPWLKFFFECGTEDEQEDRNGNGVIDSIDDTQELMRELAVKGYDAARDIRYLEIAGGHHDVATWARAMPEFLLWAFGK